MIYYEAMQIFSIIVMSRVSREGPCNHCALLYNTVRNKANKGEVKNFENFTGDGGIDGAESLDCVTYRYRTTSQIIVTFRQILGRCLG